MAAVAWIMLALCAPGVLAGPMYVLTDLGTLGGSSSYAYAINNQGQVAGKSLVNSATPPAEHAFLFSGGVLMDLGVLGGDMELTNISAALGINDMGQIVGYSTTSNSSLHAFLYENGAMKDLGTLGGTTSEAYGVNNNGQIVGWADTAGTSNPSHAFLWSDGVMSDLGFSGTATAINSHGEITGWINTNCDCTGEADSEAFVYSNATLALLGAAPGLDGLYAEVGGGINNSGQIAGEAGSLISPDDAAQACVYTGGRWTVLGGLSGGYSNTVAMAVNVSGQITGHAGTSDGLQHAFLYSGGAMMDLNNLIDTNSGWTLEYANAINDHGLIAGWGRNSAGNQHAFLLTPIPVLSITSSGGAVEIAWPTNGSNYALMEMNDLTGGNWTAVTNIPVVIGDSNQVTITPACSCCFFQLRSQ